jgi:hypothetical protein
VRAAYEVIEKLEGKPGDAESGGRISRLQREIVQKEAELPTHISYQDYWVHFFRLQSKKWRLEDVQVGLADAKVEAARLCPESPCIKTEDLILWEFHSLEKEYIKAQRASKIEDQCEWDLMDYVDIPFDPSRLPNCIANKDRSAHWLHLAYTQSRADALSTHMISSLIPQPTLEDLIANKISELERDIVRDTARAIRMYDWLPALPEDAEEARLWFESEASPAANGPWYMRDRIVELREMVAGGEEVRKRLRRCFDDPQCP